jgi:hypothetical protein
VILIFATSPAQKMFVRQVKEITRRYRQLSVQNALFFVAFTRESGLVTRSDVPFVVLPDPSSVITGQRILDVIVNSYQRQVQSRRS